MSEIRYDGKVAIVTGAGGGIGKSHALALAKRGAKVVINDLGGAVDGTGGSLTSAEAVVKEITDAGGGYACGHIVETDGIYLPPDRQTPENIAAKWDEISSRDNIQFYDNVNGPLMNFMTKAQSQS